MKLGFKKSVLQLCQSMPYMIPGIGGIIVVGFYTFLDIFISLNSDASKKYP